MENRNNTPLPPVTVTDVLKKLDDARALLAGFIITLTPKQRQEIPKMGDKSLAFVTKAAELTVPNAALVPTYVDADALRLDANTAAQLGPVIQRLEGLLYDVESTQMIAGSEGYTSALLVYGAFQQAARAAQPGAQAAVDDLKQRFARARADRPAPSAPDGSAATAA